MTVTPNEKFHYRPVPCSASDADRLEAWLEDMAADEGFLLSSDGFMTGFGIFYHRQPTRIKYRLIPAAKATSLLWDPDNGSPSLQEQADRERYGWEYLTRYGDFHIYRSETPHATDLPTDREAREEALKLLTKRYRDSVLGSVLTGFVASAALKGNLLRGILYLGTWKSLLLAALLASFLLQSIVSATHYSRLRRRVRDEDRFHGEKADWRSHAPLHHLLNFSQITLVIAAVWMILALWSASTDKHFLTPTANYPGNPPFATVADLADANQRILPYEGHFSSHGYRVWADPLLSSCCMEWDEAGTIYSVGAAEATGSFVTLDVDYYDVTTRWLARAVAWEIRWGDRFLNRRYEELTIPSAEDLGVDRAVAYAKSGTHFPTVILQKDNRVYRAYFSLDEGLELKDVVRKMAAALQ